MRRIIFLDIDGVLNTKFWYAQGKRDKYGNVFDPNAVDNLAKIIEETGADIVISSSWKIMGISMLQGMWKDRDLPGKIIDVTPDIMCDELLMSEEDINYLYNRGSEIKGWLLQHKDENIQYVILYDFDDILPEQQLHFIQTYPDIGITKGNVVQAIMILKGGCHRDR